MKKPDVIQALEDAGVDFDEKANYNDLVALLKETQKGGETPGGDEEKDKGKKSAPKKEKAIKPDPELIEAKMKAGLSKDQAIEVATAQAKFDAAE